MTREFTDELLKAEIWISTVLMASDKPFYRWLKGLFVKNGIYMKFFVISFQFNASLCFGSMLTLCGEAWVDSDALDSIMAFFTRCYGRRDIETLMAFVTGGKGCVGKIEGDKSRGAKKRMTEDKKKWKQALKTVTRMDVPPQEDSGSCGVLGVIAIERAVNDHFDWDAQPAYTSAEYHRIRFLRLCTGYAKPEDDEIAKAYWAVEPDPGNHVTADEFEHDYILGRGAPYREFYGAEFIKEVTKSTKTGPKGDFEDDNSDDNEFDGDTNFEITGESSGNGNCNGNGNDKGKGKGYGGGNSDKSKGNEKIKNVGEGGRGGRHVWNEDEDDEDDEDEYEGVTKQTRKIVGTTGIRKETDSWIRRDRVDGDNNREEEEQDEGGNEDEQEQDEEGQNRQESENRAVQDEGDDSGKTRNVLV
ncbi:MAG: hypothetical protein J3Q66DRAFT_371362 [Benniella sp.]|nr:MAG: hypothetical protein J3Q66DRAFT_371362 [Benniella sp.]